MRDITELFGDGTRIGEVDVRRGDRRAHARLRAAVGQAGIKALRIHPRGKWLRPLTPEDIAGSFAPKLAALIVKKELSIVVSPARLSRDPAHSAAGSAITRAAMRAAEETGRTITILEGRGISGEQGQWAALTADQPGSLTLVPDSELARKGITYTVHTINPGVRPGGSAESLFASGTL